MLHKEVRTQLLVLLGSPATLTRRKNQIKLQYGPMSSDEAGYVLAHMLEIDLSRYLPNSTIDKVRSLVPQDAGVIRETRPVVQKPPQKKSRRYPLINSSRVKSAFNLGEKVYPQVFLLENSIRELIRIKLITYGTDWWDQKVPASIRKNVARIMNIEKRYPYRDRRGNHPLLYTNFSNLKTIILKNKGDFEIEILDFLWFEAKMDEVYMARNNLAHCVPLTSDDRKRISLFHRDWARLMETAGH